MVTVTVKILGTVVEKLCREFATELEALDYCRKNMFHYECYVTLPDGITYRTYANERG